MNPCRMGAARPAGEGARMNARAWLSALIVAGLSLAPASGKDVPHLTLKSGTPQTARAWVAARATRYETDFNAALVVNVSPAKLKVRFRRPTNRIRCRASTRAPTTSKASRERPRSSSRFGRSRRKTSSSSPNRRAPRPRRSGSNSTNSSAQNNFATFDSTATSTRIGPGC